VYFGRLAGCHRRKRSLPMEKKIRQRRNSMGIFHGANLGGVQTSLGQSPDPQRTQGWFGSRDIIVRGTYGLLLMAACKTDTILSPQNHGHSQNPAHRSSGNTHKYVALQLAQLWPCRSVRRHSAILVDLDNGPALPRHDRRPLAPLVMSNLATISARQFI
jgi:hypothetical protein